VNHICISQLDNYFDSSSSRCGILEQFLRLVASSGILTCIVKLEAAHTAICTNLDHDDVKEIEISGRSKIGKVYNEDEVIVEILEDEREAYKGKNHIHRLNKTLDLSKMTLKIMPFLYHGILDKNCLFFYWVFV
jgi:hypothetical protein